MEDHATRLLVKVAQLYHLQGLNQDQVGRQLGVSRSKVSRMLKEARDRGLVEISIHYPVRFSLELERQLESALGLREAVVVNVGGDSGGQASGAVAGAAAEYLQRLLQPGDVLGVSGGETVALTAQVMPSNTTEGVSVAQLGAAVPMLGEGMAYSSAEVALQLAQKLGGMDRLVLIPVPSLLDTATIRDALLLDTGVQQAMALLASCTVALVGIGTPETLARGPAASRGARVGRGCRRRLLSVSEDEVAELHRAGAVGEICARFYDLAGQPCATSLDRRMVGLDLAQLRSVPLVVGVAAGPQKAAAILGAARGGYVKTLVTDDLTAMAVLKLARTGASADTDGADTVCPQQGTKEHTSSRGTRTGSTRTARWPTPSVERAQPNNPPLDTQRTPGPAQLAHS